MSTANIELYNALIKAGVKETQAKRVAEEVLTKEDAKNVLATKEDIHNQTKWFVSALLAQGALVVSLLHYLG